MNHMENDIYTGYGPSQIEEFNTLKIGQTINFRKDDQSGIFEGIVLNKDNINAIEIGEQGMNPKEGEYPLKTQIRFDRITANIKIEQ